MRENEYIAEGQRFKEIRYDLSLKQSEISDILKISRTKISEIERGITMPSISFLLGLRKHFSVNIFYILLGEGEMFIDPKNITKYTLDLTAMAIKPEVMLQFLKDFEKSKILQYKIIGEYFISLNTNKNFIENK